jgi:hypothetical protein
MTLMKNALAAGSSRFSDSMKSTVLPSLCGTTINGMKSYSDD